MAGLLSSRGWSCALLATALSLPTGASSAGAAEGAVWTLDPAAAAAQARKQGKFLLVVHFSGDFAAGEESDQARLYRQLTLDEPRVARALKQRFVASYRHVGPSPLLIRKQQPGSKAGKDSAPGQAASSAELAIAYFCLPDERVLHYVPGFLSADELLAELRWLEAGYAESSQLADAAAPLYWRTRHQGKIAQADRVEFQRLAPSRWKDEQLVSGNSTVDLPPAIAAARTIFERALAARMPAGRREALANHGALGVETAHLVLAEFPLIALSDLARPAYENATGQRFWELSPRRKQLAAWWADCRRQRAPALLVVKDDYYQVSVEEGRLPSPGIPEYVDPSRLKAEVVSLDELALLIADASLEPIAYSAAEVQPRYVLYDGQGFRCALLMAGEGQDERLKAAIGAAVGPAAIRGGGVKD